MRGRRVSGKAGRGPRPGSKSAARTASSGEAGGDGRSSDDADGDETGSGEPGLDEKVMSARPTP
jgi:hypothetical protein